MEHSRDTIVQCTDFPDLYCEVGGQVTICIQLESRM